MRAIELFAGVGGFRLGLERAGHSVIWSNEWDKYAADTYDKNFGGQINRQSITDVRAEDIPEHDIIVGGFPCQAFSIAGKRKGFDETRGTLFFDIMRIAQHHRTPYLFLENVKGLLNHDSGRTFEVILKTLDESGYDCQWQVLNSKDFGVPQNRERIFIIGHLRGRPRPEVFPLGNNQQETNELSGQNSNTLTARYYGGQANGTYIAEDKLSTQIRQLNQPVHSNDRVYAPDGLSPTLNTMQGGNRQPFIKTDNSAIMGLHHDRETSKLDDRALESKKKLRTEEVNLLDLQDEKGTDRDTSHRRELAQQQDREPTGTLSGLPYQTSSEKTKLQARGMREDSQAERLLRETQPKVQEVREPSDGQEQPAHPDYRIRRLTVVECERLQSFPDGHTKYGLKLDGTTYEMSDTQRYKQMGNAVTVNVIEAIAKQLKKGN